MTCNNPDCMGKEVFLEIRDYPEVSQYKCRACGKYQGHDYACMNERDKEDSQ